MAKSKIRQWADRLTFRDKSPQKNDKKTKLQRGKEAGSVSPAQTVPKPELENQSAYHPPAFPPAWACEWGEDQYGLYADLQITGDTEREVRQRFRWIAPGEFMMGSPDNETKRFSREGYHKVTLTKGYWVADTAVTQAVWEAVTGQNPAYFRGNELNPVEQISWIDIYDFFTELNRWIEETGRAEASTVFRLPTEAEWEHACRAGTKMPFSFGENITPEEVNYNGNFPYADEKKGEYRETTVSVKSLPPNPWRIYEMHGNVWEWCADTWQEYLGEETVFDPYDNSGGSDRVMRGGSWYRSGSYVRSAYRSRSSPVKRDRRNGFRLASGHELRGHGSAK